jgi:hypothetical protein
MFLEEYKNGRRIRPVFKSTIKDEVLTKPKARVFDVAPTGMTMIGRKYMADLNRFFQEIPTISEVCVGINCHGPEATLLRNHVTKFGEDRMIAGDYKNYDCDMPVEVLRAAINIYMKVAKFSENYSEEDLKAMNTFAWDLTNPTVDYFGAFIILNDGTHLSGNNMTADLNGIANSLLARCCYYSAFLDGNFSHGAPPFRSMVAYIAYGDDNWGSISHECTWFNMMVMSQKLAGWGLVFTDPSKSSVVKKFLGWTEVDFLKRSFCRKHEVGVYLGALDKKSIFKPLCKIVHSPRDDVGIHDVARDTLTSAMVEAFNHGREFYDYMRDGLIRVADKMGYVNVPMLNMTFDERMEAWFETYADQLKCFE